MSQFLRLLVEDDKAAALTTVCTRLRQGGSDSRAFSVVPEAFDSIPGKPFAYWVSKAVRETFRRLPPFESNGRTAKQGLATADDFRFVRCWWEIDGLSGEKRWFPFAKGGSYSPYYADVYLAVNWARNGSEIKNNLNEKGGVRSNVWMLKDTADNFFLKEGLTWPRRAHLKGSFRVIPREAIFSDSGPCVFEEDPLVLAAILNSSAYLYLLMLLMPRGTEGGQTLKYEVGYVASVPVPIANSAQKDKLRSLGLRSWCLKRVLDSIGETSHAFVLPAGIRERIGDYDSVVIEAELARIQSEIDTIVFELYGFSEADRAAAQGKQDVTNDGEAADSVDDESDDKDNAAPIDQTAGLLSWAVGVAFGRFDWRLATGERVAPPEPEPFDPLPAKSPGMLPDGAEPFHHHAGILVDDKGHQHDLPRLIEQVLEIVDGPVNQDIRRWLRKDFFPFHLQQYSKSRRKAPIYWPLSTASGSYTLWLYYPVLTSQTLFTAVNDFLEGESGRLSLVKQDVAALRNKGSSRTKQEEKELEKLEDLEQELADLRDTLLEIAPNYRPNQDDGVQITAAPLWSLFRHKPWQKVLKDTWKQLEKGDFDWAHLALNYWPDRVLRKCHKDRSLAIAHDVEELFWEEIEVPVIRRGKDTGETKLEWQSKDLSEAQLQALINQVRQERSL